MRNLRKIHDSDIFPGSIDRDPRGFYERYAARAIVSNAIGAVALLWVGKYGYHKLPGGGLKKGESRELASKRESREELGAFTRIVQDVGSITEYRGKSGDSGLVQTSFCFAAEQVGQLGTPQFTKHEIDDGFEVIWVENHAKAIITLEHDDPTDYGGHFVKERDLTFLRVARNLNL